MSLGATSLFNSMSRAAFFVALGLTCFVTSTEASTCRFILSKPPAFRQFKARYWSEGGTSRFLKNMVIESASVQEVIHALQNVDPRRVAPLMEIQDLDSPRAPNTKYYFLKMPNPLVPGFMSALDPLSLLGSKITMSRTTAGFDMVAIGPIVNGWDRITAFEKDGHVIVREEGALGGSVQNHGHAFAFDLIPELRRLIGR
ncbi:MAG: hypothetical protein ABL958_07670 [Bdellovibrionia bacterium]